MCSLMHSVKSAIKPCCADQNALRPQKTSAGRLVSSRSAVGILLLSGHHPLLFLQPPWLLASGNISTSTSIRHVLLGFSPARRAGKASRLALPRAAVVFVKAMLSRRRRAMCTYWQTGRHLWSSSSTTRPHSLRIDSDRGPGLSLPTRLPNMYLR